MINNPIYAPKGRAKEYCDLAVNIYKGCNHGCVYCWARKIAKRFTPKGSICNFDNPELRRDIVESVKKKLSKGKIKGCTIQLCFSCDPYPDEIDTTPTREVIEAVKNSGNHVQILTKGGFRALDDFDLLDAGDQFGVTITSDDFWIEENEPNAAPLTERSQSLFFAHAEGIKTWVSFEPVVSPEIVYQFIEKCDYIDFYKIGVLNYEPSSIEWGSFGRECERLLQKHNRNYYIKDDLRRQMGTTTTIIGTED